MKKLINDLSSEIAYLLDNPTNGSVYMVEEEVITTIQDLVTKLEDKINDSERFLAKLEGKEEK
jgi:nucleoside-diphosphate-sugar epimerase